MSEGVELNRDFDVVAEAVADLVRLTDRDDDTDGDPDGAPLPRDRVTVFEVVAEADELLDRVRENVAVADGETLNLLIDIVGDAVLEREMLDDRVDVGELLNVGEFDLFVLVTEAENGGDGVLLFDLVCEGVNVLDEDLLGRD